MFAFLSRQGEQDTLKPVKTGLSVYWSRGVFRVTMNSIKLKDLLIASGFREAGRAWWVSIATPLRQTMERSLPAVKWSLVWPSTTKETSLRFSFRSVATSLRRTQRKTPLIRMCEITFPSAMPQTQTLDRKRDFDVMTSPDRDINNQNSWGGCSTKKTYEKTYLNFIFIVRINDNLVAIY